MQRSSLKRTVTLVVGMLVTMGLVLPSSTALAQDQDVVGQIKATFDAAMAKPLEERIPLLENLERDIGQDVFQSSLAGKAKVDGLYYKYHSQLQLAKYPEASQTYIIYVGAIKDYSSVGRAHSIFLRDMSRLIQKRRLVQSASICAGMATEFSSEPTIEATALYHLAKSKFHMIGTRGQSLEVCKKLISEHVDSPWRPKAMWMLADAYHKRADNNAALAMLKLLKEQYPNTKYAQYADMRPAAIYEVGKGDLQKALAIYQQTLKSYTDHIYAPYIHRQIERLQKVIEQQLIQDALDGIVTMDLPECRSTTLIVEAIPTEGKQIVSRFHK